MIVQNKMIVLLPSKSKPYTVLWTGKNFILISTMLHKPRTFAAPSENPICLRVPGILPGLRTDSKCTLYAFTIFNKLDKSCVLYIPATKTSKEQHRWLGLLWLPLENQYMTLWTPGPNVEPFTWVLCAFGPQSGSSHVTDTVESEYATRRKTVPGHRWIPV